MTEFRLTLTVTASAWVTLAIIVRGHKTERSWRVYNQLDVFDFWRGFSCKYSYVHCKLEIYVPITCRSETGTYIYLLLVASEYVRCNKADLNIPKTMRNVFCFHREHICHILLQPTAMPPKAARIVTSDVI